MKRKIFLTLLTTFTLIASFAQTTITGDRVVAKQSLYVNGSWVDSIQKKGDFNSQRAIPSSQGVKDLLNSGGVVNNYLPKINEPDFEIEVFPDIQNMVAYNDSIKAMGRSMFDWVKRNKDSQNIKALLQVGDITNWTTTAEWDTASAWFNKLDSVGIPYVTAIGNHDYASQSPASRNATLYNTYFGASRYSTKSHFGGYFSNDPLNQGYANSFYKFDAGSNKFFVLNLEFLPRDTVLNWAGKVLDSLYAVEPDRQVMIVTHGYMTAFNELATDTSVYSTSYYGLTNDNSGQEMWDKLIKLKPNIRFVFGGHYLLPSTWAQNGLHGLILSSGVNGNLVTQIMVNYQDDVAWGNGYFMRLKFSPSQAKVYVSFFSSYYNAYDSRVDSFNLDVPPVQVQSSMSVGGNVAIVKDLRVAGKIKVETLKKTRIPFIGNGNVFQDNKNLFYDKGSLFVKQDSPLVAPLVLQYSKATSSLNPLPAIFSLKDSSGKNIFDIKGYYYRDTGNHYFPSIYIGDSCGTSSGISNVAIGSYAVQKSTGGGISVAVGVEALKNHTAPFGLTAVGFQAMYSMTSGGVSDVAVGPQAMYSAQSNVKWCTAVGQNGMVNLVSGQDNTAVGQNAMGGLSAGNYNVAVGSTALGSTPVYVANNNTAIGIRALKKIAGDNNVAVGMDAGAGVTGAGNVFMGYMAGPPSGTCSNKLYIHNAQVSNPLIYGEFDNRLLKINGKLTLTDVLNLPSSTAPTSSSDATGTDGELRRDASGNIYLKAGSSWLKFTGVTF